MRRRSTDDILQLAKNSELYSALLNNYTLSGNETGLLDDGNSALHDRYEAAVVYGDTRLTITNLRHFQEYSIEVSPAAAASHPTALHCISAMMIRGEDYQNCSVLCCV